MKRVLCGSAFVACAWLSAFGCSSGDGGDGANGSAGLGSGNAGSPGIPLGSAGRPGAGAGGAAGAIAWPGAGTGAGGGAAASCAPAPDDEGCVGQQYEGETAPLDVYILFDQSCSMSCNVSRTGPGQCCRGASDGRIFPVREAMDLFLHDPQSAGIGFGIGYFGYMPVGRTSCDPTDYDTPAVAIGPNQADGIVASLRAAEPTGETPTGAAIRGACGYTQSWKQANPGRSVVILLVTDGIPETPSTGCGATLPDAVAAARTCAEDAGVKTYVLGVGQALDNLNQIASAGGTERAQLVEGGDVTQSVLAALNTIRGDAIIPCQLRIPPPPAGGQLDFGRVNLGICNATGAHQPTYYVQTPEGCEASGGWHYDDPSNPQRIILCEASCETVNVPGAKLFYSVGCGTKPPIR